MSCTAILGGAAVLSTATVLAKRNPATVSPLEQRWFTAINRAPDGLRPLLWPTMQLGNGAMAAAVPLAVVAATRTDPDWGLAARGAAAALGAWGLAKAVKQLVNRGRPGEFFSDVRFRDGVPAGLGYVSGHTAVAAAVATVFAPRLSPATRAIGHVLAATVGTARVFVGAHLPLDVVGGAGLGLMWGGLLAERSEDSR